MHSFIRKFVLSVVGSALMGAGCLAWANQVTVEPEQPSEPSIPAMPSEPAFYSVESGSYLGIDTQDVTADRLQELKLKEERGVEVLMVDQDAPAGKAGLKEHDVILDFNGTKVESVEQLRRMIHEVPPGRQVTLGISRDGQPMNVPVKLEDRAKAFNSARIHTEVMPVLPSTPVMPIMPDIEIPAMDFSFPGVSRAGLLVENLTPQLGEFFGVKNGDGVLVRSVEKGSAAETAGFKAGDVIVRIEQEKVSNRGQWSMALRNHHSGKVTVGIVRDKREQTVPLVLPQKKGPNESGVFKFDSPEMQSLMERVRREINSADFKQLTSQATAEALRTVRQNLDEIDRAFKTSE